MKAVVRMLTDPLNVVRYVGMPVAAVAAIDEATCNARTGCNWTSNTTCSHL